MSNFNADKAPRRSEARSEVSSLVLREPRQVQAYLLEHPLSHGGKLWCDKLIEGVGRGERWAMNLFGRVMKWVGADVEITNVLVQTLGDGATPEKAQAAWSAYRKVQGVSQNEDALAQQVEQWLESYYAKQGRRLLVIRDGDELGVIAREKSDPGASSEGEV